MTTCIEKSDQKLNSHPNNQDTSKSIKRSLSIATAIMMGSVLLSRIAGLLREQVMANFSGTSSDMDAYVTAFLIPELLNHFLAGGFLSVTFIPIFQRKLLDGNKDGAWSSFSNLISIGSVAFCILIPLGILFTPDLLTLMGAAKSPEQMKLTVRLTRIILPAQIFFYWGSFFSAVQMANKRFFLPAVAPLLYNFGIIICGILLVPYIGVEGFAWGVLIGAFLGNVGIQFPGALKTGLRFKFRFNINDPDFIQYVKKTVPLILGLGMAFSNEIFFRFFSRYLPDGTTSSVNYALRTMMMVVAFFGQASGFAFFPFLSELAAKKQFEKMTAMLNSVLKKIALYLLPLSGLMILLSEQIISILFERGHFSHQSTLQTASIFAVYLTGSFTYSASLIVNRSFYALQNTLLPMIVSTATALLTIPLYIILSKPMGGTGIALASVFGMALQFIVLYGLWYHKHASLKKMAAAIPGFLKICGICFAGCIVGYFFKKWGIALNFKNHLLINFTVCIISALPSLFTVFLLYEITGIQKLRESIRGLIRKK